MNALCEEYLNLSYHGLRTMDKIFTADYKTDFDPNLPHINVIPQEIGRVLLNIINNAFYACMHNDIPSFGKGMESRKPLVTITTRFIAEESPLFVSNALQKIGKSGRQWIQISIADNGSGIPDDIKDKIFQPFFTTKPTGKGTGLGLSLSYDIIKAHGGELSLDSNSEGGATFKILLKKED